MRSLYVCYFNTEEPLVHTQVLPYLRALARAGVRMHLLTYEKRGAWRASERARRRELRRRLAADGIHWHALKYHKRPSLLATGADVLFGILYSTWLIARHRIHIVHARAHVPGVIALPSKLFLRRKLIFDLRGLMAEEYVDNGAWAAGSLPVHLVKAAERALLIHADRIIVLTEKLSAELSDGPDAVVEAGKISVIPCCADLARYEAGEQRWKDQAGHLMTLVYVGSLTGRYLLDEMIEFFKVLRARRSGLRFLVLTRTNKPDVERAFDFQGIDRDSYSIVSSEPERVPSLIQAGDFAISFVKRSVAVLGMSPTKIGEYLAAGLPVVSTRGGDTDTILEAENVGVIVEGFSAADYERAADQIFALLREGQVRERCRKVARTRYSLADVGGPRYIEVYRTLGCFADPIVNHEPLDAGEIVVDSRSRAKASIGQKT